jgi:hypothetical protein
MSPTDVHHRRTMRGFSLILVGAGLLAVNWEHMRRLSDASDQSGIR